MRPISTILTFALAAGITVPGLARELSYKVLDPNAYQSFVANWTPRSTPLCAAMQSQADWDAIFHPAPVLGTNRPFGPPSELWSGAGVLMVA